MDRTDYMEYVRDLWEKYSLIPCLVGFVVLYSSYYLFYVVKKPTFAIGNGKFRQLLIEHCPLLDEYYWPTFWCFQSHAQTITRVFLQWFPEQQYVKEIVPTPDGGELHLDWLHNENDIFKDSAKRPTVLILPGLTSSSKDNYILNLVESSKHLGYRCLVIHYRGLGESKLLTPRSYCASNTDDVSQVISHFHSKYPDAPLAAVGISLGGLILFNYLAKTGENCGLVAGMSISQAYNMFVSSNTLEQAPVNIIFNKYLTHHLTATLRNHQTMFEKKYDLNKVYKSSTIREFDEHFTSKVFGYASHKEYYTDCCTMGKIADIKVPLLCLNAADDPFSPLKAIPLDEANKNDMVAFWVTTHGGHIAFLEGPFPRGASYLDRVYVQYIEAIFKHWMA